jgi:hypothetical protein
MVLTRASPAEGRPLCAHRTPRHLRDQTMRRGRLFPGLLFAASDSEPRANPNRPTWLQRRSARMARMSASSTSLRFGSTEAARPKPRELAAISAPSRVMGAQSPRCRTTWRWVQASANSSPGSNSLINRENTRKSPSPGPGMAPIHFSTRSQGVLPPISLKSGTGKLFRASRDLRASTPRGAAGDRNVFTSAVSDCAIPIRPLSASPERCRPTQRAGGPNPRHAQR